MTGLTVGQNRKVRIEGDDVLFLILCGWNDEKEEKNLGPSSCLEHQKNGDALHGDKEDWEFHISDQDVHPVR